MLAPETLFLNVSLKKQKSISIFEEYDKSLVEEMDDYDSLPEYFTGRDTWPNSCNLHCSNCDLSFRGTPWFVPLNKIMRLDKITNEQIPTLLPYLVFCTPFCLEYYVNNVNDPKIYNKWDIHELIKEEMFLLTKRRPIYIPEAPLKTTMIQYRGPTGISPNEYRELLERLWNSIIYVDVKKKLF